MPKITRGGFILGGLLSLYALSPVLAWVVLALVATSLFAWRKEAVPLTAEESPAA